MPKVFGSEDFRPTIDLSRVISSKIMWIIDDSKVMSMQYWLSPDHIVLMVQDFWRHAPKRLVSRTSVDRVFASS